MECDVSLFFGPGACARSLDASAGANTHAHATISKVSPKKAGLRVCMFYRGLIFTTASNCVSIERLMAPSRVHLMFRLVPLPWNQAPAAISTPAERVSRDVKDERGEVVAVMLGRGKDSNVRLDDRIARSPWAACVLPW